MIEISGEIAKAAPNGSDLEAHALDVNRKVEDALRVAAGISDTYAHAVNTDGNCGCPECPDECDEDHDHGAVNANADADVGPSSGTLREYREKNTDDVTTNTNASGSAGTGLSVRSPRRSLGEEWDANVSETLRFVDEDDYGTDHLPTVYVWNEDTDRQLHKGKGLVTPEAVRVATDDNGDAKPVRRVGSQEAADRIIRPVNAEDVNLDDFEEPDPELGASTLAEWKKRLGR